MNLKVYKKTRYQNIYQHIKNKNYVISISKPEKTSIAEIDGAKIYDIDEAINIRDNARKKKKKDIKRVGGFDELFEKYIDYCKNIEKLAYNTILKKEKFYNSFFKNQISKNINKTNELFWSSFISKLDTTLKQKNEIIKCLKAFFNWCKDQKYILDSPLENVNRYKVPKAEMKYWTSDELKRFLECVRSDLNSSNKSIKAKAFLTKTLVEITFTLGDRIGETRALTFGSIDVVKETLSILHSINYDRTSDDFVSNTKTYESERIVDISQKLINSIRDYRLFLEKELEYNVTDDTLIFFNHQTKRPYSDVTLRKHFYYYCNKANVTKIRMYDLRHTYVANMMAEGKEAYLFSKRIGHKNISTTIDIYGHLSNKTRKELAQATDKYI